ncbi:MAG: nuclear transport factor 2 family protein [Deltaproteobacteria bacterium]|nr:nuclear transport factor 2 family protein [Deltaproteobacteria bacterium]
MPAYKPEDCDILLIEAAHKGDLETAVALYEPNASFVRADTGQVVVGPAAIREVFQSVLALKPKYTMEVKAVSNGDGDLALTSTTWSVTGVEADGNPLPI